MLYDPSKTFEVNVAEGPFEVDAKDYRDSSASPSISRLELQQVPCRPLNIPAPHFGLATM